ncbi:NAD-dependent epimerase/dehydratase family protein [Paenibacillus sp. TC-CSREp1]|uniref:NAD-dependent epimerase/dehydratase family protein n=1 Tax=Paenibacillus sp. TC-CSREp1 TaxID=3410089 RepID=UPI003CF838A2
MENMGLDSIEHDQSRTFNLQWEPGFFGNEIIEEDLDYITQKLEQRHLFSGCRFLITGGGGFIGYYLVLALLHTNRSGTPIKHITVLDRFPKGIPSWLERLQAEGEPLTAVVFDVTTDSFSDYISGTDYIFHMASIASPSFYRKYPLRTLEANVFGLQRLLHSCLSHQPKGILYFSSSEIYGNPDPEYIPTSEQYNGNVATIGPRACYDESKRMGETICSLYHQEHQLPVRIVRPFNNYGPGLELSDQRVAADFAKSIKEKRAIDILSDGTPTRTYCYIADAIVGYFKVITHSEFDVFNIGADSQEISVSRLAQLFAECSRELTGYFPAVTYQESADPHYLTHNPQRRCPSIEKARKLLRFNPEIGLEEGIRRYLISCGVGQ